MGKGRSVTMALALAATAGLCRSARAKGADAIEVSEAARPTAATRAAAGSFLPTSVGAAVEPGAHAVTFAGYDANRDGATAVAAAEVRLFGPVALRGGVTYVSALDAGEGAWQPHVMLRAQVLRQSAHGLDASVGAAYRLERFTPDAGMVQALVTLGRRFGAVTTLANVAYGQDPEGDDREGDVRVAALVRATDALLVGVDASARFDLFSSDARRAARGEHELDLAAGPVAAFAIGDWALLAQAGVSASRAQVTKVGALALAGIGASF
jgi:hypothetical protein